MNADPDPDPATQINADPRPCQRVFDKSRIDNPQLRKLTSKTHPEIKEDERFAASIPSLMAVPLCGIGVSEKPPALYKDETLSTVRYRN